MGFLNSLFGGSDNTLLIAFFALGVVLVLIVLGVWALKLLFKATGAVGRGRNRRLSVVDTTAIDAKRQLVLVRCDDSDYLLLIGGPQDVVIERGITPPVEVETPRRPGRRSMTAVSTNSTDVDETPKTVAPKAPVSTAPGTNADAAIARLERMTHKPEPAAPVTAPNPAERAIEKAAEPGMPRKLNSLRHTGLMRPGGRVEPALHPQPSAPKSEFKAPVANDSATKSPEPAIAEPVKAEPVLDNNTADGSDKGALKTTDDVKADATT